MRPLRLALRRPLRTSRGVLREREGFILELFASSGARGAGEASPAYWLGDERIAETRASLARVVHAAAKRPEMSDLRALMLEHSPCLTPAAACALDTALLALSARERGVAVASMLGAQECGPIPVCALLAGRTVEERQREAACALGAGYRCLKIKVGAGAIDDDIRRVEAVRQVVGDGIAIRLDANRGWSLAHARAAISRLSAMRIEFLEEPLSSPTPEALSELGAAGPIPIALDESVRDIGDLARFVERRAADVIVLKAARLGGLRAAMRLARFATEAGMKVVVTDSIESPLGMSAAIHLAAAAAPRLAIGLGGARMLAEQSLREAGFVPSPWVRAAAVGLDVVWEARSGGSSDG